MEPLLTRDAFNAAVLQRDGGLCVRCGDEAADVHHLLDRKLWPNSGNFVSNGVSVCQDDHLLCERTTLSCAELRALAGITTVALPPGLTPDEEYDHWGNPILADGTRARGPLFYDEGCQKALSAGGVLHLFSDRVKHARTPHLPWSPSRSADDLGLDTDAVFAGREVVVTEKMDGENTSIYSDGGCHARSLDSRHHPSRAPIKALAASLAGEIPWGWRVVGENLYARHTVAYDRLPGYLLVVAVFDQQNNCLSWDATVEWAELLGLPTVPVLWRGTYDEQAIRAAWDGTSRYGAVGEGYVVRHTNRFPYEAFASAVAKYVDDAFEVPDEHWTTREVVPNGLAA